MIYSKSSCRITYLHQVVLVCDEEGTHITQRMNVDDAAALGIDDALLHDPKHLADVDSVEYRRERDVGRGFDVILGSIDGHDEEFARGIETLK